MKTVLVKLISLIFYITHLLDFCIICLNFLFSLLSIMPLTSIPWAAASVTIDNLIKEYLIKRSFTNTLKSFEYELSSEKEKGFRVRNTI